MLVRISLMTLWLLNPAGCSETPTDKEIGPFFKLKEKNAEIWTPRVVEYKFPKAVINVQVKKDVPESIELSQTPKTELEESQLAGPEISLPPQEINFESPRVTIPAPRISLQTAELSIPGRKINLDGPVINLPNPEISTLQPQITLPDPQVKTRRFNINLPGSIIKVQNPNLIVEAPIVLATRTPPTLSDSSVKT